MFTGDLPAEHLLQCVSVFDVLARQTERTFTLFGIKPQQETDVIHAQGRTAARRTASVDLHKLSPGSRGGLSQRRSLL